MSAFGAHWTASSSSQRPARAEGMVDPKRRTPLALSLGGGNTKLDNSMLWFAAIARPVVASSVLPRSRTEGRQVKATEGCT